LSGISPSRSVVFIEHDFPSILSPSIFLRRNIFRTTEYRHTLQALYGLKFSLELLFARKKNSPRSRAAPKENAETVGEWRAVEEYRRKGGGEAERSSG